METDRLRNSQDGPRNDSRSFGSNCHPYSQSRKMSIGVIVDSSMKTRPKTTKADEAGVPIAEEVFIKANSIDVGNNAGGNDATIIGKQAEAPEHGTSPWVSTRSFHQRSPTSDTIRFAKLTMNLPTDGSMPNTSNGVNAAARKYSLQSFGNQMAVLQSGDDNQKNFDRFSLRSGGKDEIKEREDKCLPSTVQETLVPKKEEVVGKTTATVPDDRREALRMKLWDILGSVSSPNKKISQAPQLGLKDLNLEHNHSKESKLVVKLRQNSDTIETDSESLDHSLRRPVTRSLTRKRSSNKLQRNKIGNVPSSTYTLKHPDKNIFSFEEGFSKRSVPNPKSRRKKSERKVFKIEAHRMYVPCTDCGDEIEKTTDTSKKTMPARRQLSLVNRMGSFHNFPAENSNEFVNPDNQIKKKDPLLLPATKMTDPPDKVKNSSFRENWGKQDDLANSPLKNTVDSDLGIQSPTFEIRTPSKSHSPSFPATMNGKNLNDQSPGHCSFNSLLTAKLDCCRTNMGMESFDNAEEDSPFMRSEPEMERKDAENSLSNLSSEERDSKSSKEDSPIIEGYKGRRTEVLSPEIGDAGEPKIFIDRTIRLWRQEDIKFTEFSPIPASPKGTPPLNSIWTEDNNDLQEPSCQNQDDEMAKAITLIALALQRIKSKIKSVTIKKSAEVLTSAAEGIYLQLQSTESQIQSDVGKLTGVSKSKRKRLEAEFEAQQEQLKLLHSKFKTEINQLLQEYRHTVEGLEAQRIELKGSVEKQTSQKKLLKQAEEAIDTQLTDAEKRITAVHKASSFFLLFELEYVLVC
ncbi:meiosis-specific protein ASY3 isoform X2 [Diospyros lotus]|uniref:meiosis-specific protein ASY3 isoform X2 n=1 Tax=Diospyros lotus TaxID=55363 RepID=UPI002253EAE8|nr:meiosis-specific protein ASY3 isoform X2 [Diospyros lotus]